jgi:hypothetical protein
VSLHQTISHGFPAAEQIVVGPALLQAAVPIDARPAVAVVAQTVDAP